jgi:hypothetical protein
MGDIAILAQPSQTNEVPEKHIGAGMRIAKPLASVELHEIAPQKTIPIDLRHLRRFVYHPAGFDMTGVQQADYPG